MTLNCDQKHYQSLMYMTLAVQNAASVFLQRPIALVFLFHPPLPLFAAVGSALQA